MSKYDGRGSPDTRFGTSLDTEMELRQMREDADAPPKGEHLLTRRNRIRRAAQQKLDGMSSRYGR